MVDGANLNNNFGLTSDLLPGGGNPIPLDAYQEISINLSPFDVKQSGFTGAAVSAITKSGTNTFHGSAYGDYRDQSFNGTNVAGTKLASPAKSNNKIYGLTFGGPIIKNKLFFFVNGEIEQGTAPGITYVAKGSTASGTQSNVPIDSLAKLYNYLNSQYHFNPGAYDNFPNFTSKNHKILAKIDWNISNKHKLTVKYNDFKNTGYSQISASGGINGASSGQGITYSSSRFGTQAMGFANINYSTVDKVQSGAIELNSNFSSSIHNQFLATITKISSIKGHDGETYPFVDILGLTAGSTNNYLAFGNEPFNGNNNQVINNIYTFTDNFTYYYGKHTFTAGATYEYQKLGNMFMPGSQGYYVYNSLSDFMSNAAPRLFSITYSLLPGQDAVFSANLKVGQLGFYLQDEYNVNPRLKITAGLRIDRPVYPQQPLANPALTSLTLLDKSGNNTNYSDGAWPKATLYFAPRVGFRYDVMGDRSLIVRGGTGLFTGRIPFVFLTNMPSTSGMYQYGTLVNASNSNMSNFLFNPDPHAYNPFYNKTLSPTLFPTTAGTSVPSGGITTIAPNFKFPQVWRSDLAVEKPLGGGWTATIEALYTQDYNDPVMRNANQKAPTATVTVGPNDVRAAYTGTTSAAQTAARRVNTGLANAIVLENTNKGHSLALTAQIAKSFSNGFYGSLAYTYTKAVDVTANPGSQAASVWSVNPTSGTQNDLQLMPSQYSIPHRVVATFSYRLEYVKHLASTFSLYYEGAAQGNFNYIYNGDINNDGNSADLMYIPKNPSEITFVALPASGSTPAFTAQQESDAFFQYIAQDKYLSKHQGQIAKRNGTLYPWYNRVDFSFLQDIFTNIGKEKNTLQFSASVLNFLNLIDHNWGVKKAYIYNNPLKVVAGSVQTGTPTYQLATFNNDLIRHTFQNVNSTSTTWGLQLGLKYIF